MTGSQCTVWDARLFQVPYGVDAGMGGGLVAVFLVLKSSFNSWLLWQALSKLCYCWCLQAWMRAWEGFSSRRSVSGTHSVSSNQIQFVFNHARSQGWVAHEGNSGNQQFHQVAKIRKT